MITFKLLHASSWIFETAILSNLKFSLEELSSSSPFRIVYILKSFESLHHRLYHVDLIVLSRSESGEYLQKVLRYLSHYSVVEILNTIDKDIFI